MQTRNPPEEIVHNFGFGVRRYRILHIADRIYESAFQYYSDRRGEWRLLRNSGAKLELWKMGSGETHFLVLPSQDSEVISFLLQQEQDRCRYETRQTAESQQLEAAE